MLEWLLAFFSWFLSIVLVWIVPVWFFSRDENGAKENFKYLRLDGMCRRYKGYVKIGLFNYIDINKVSANSIIRSRALTTCNRIFYHRQTTDNGSYCVYDDYWFLKLSFPAWLWDRWNYRIRKKRATRKANNEVMVSFLQAVQKDIDAERQKYLDSIKKAKDIMDTIGGGINNEMQYT